MLDKRRDRGVHPSVRRQSAQGSVEFGPAAPAIEADDSRSPPSHGGSPSRTRRPHGKRLGRRSFGPIRVPQLGLRNTRPGWPTRIGRETRSVLLAEKTEQSRIDLLENGSIRCCGDAFSRHKPAVGDECREPRRRRLERTYAIRSAGRDEHGHVDLRQVGAEVGQPGIDTRVGRGNS